MEGNKVRCLICKEEIGNPLTDDNINTFLNVNALHFTKMHVKELREYLLPKTIASIMSEEEDNLYPIYLEFYPDGDMFTAQIEIHNLLLEFVKKNTHLTDDLSITSEGKTDGVR